MPIALLCVAFILASSLVTFLACATVVYRKLIANGVHAEFSMLPVPFYIARVYRAHRNAATESLQYMVAAMEISQWIMLGLVPVFVALIMITRR